MKTTVSLLFLTIFSVQFGQAQQIVEKSFNGINSIRLNTASGDCEIVKGSGSSVDIRVEFTYDPDDYEVKMDKNGSNLVLEEKFHGKNLRGTSEWTLTVPDGLDIDFNSGSGNLELTNLKADMKYNSGSGDAIIENVEGELDFNSGSGDFEFEGVTGAIKANSGSGDHRLRSVNAEVKANTGSGDVQVVNAKGGFILNTGSGDVEAENMTLTDDGNFNTGSGDVEIVLNASPDHDISLSSGSGDAVLDFNGQRIDGNITMKAKKRGGDIRAPFEFDKVEEIIENGETYIKKTKKLGTKNIEIYVGTGTGTAQIKE